MVQERIALACRACENVERRLNALQQEVPERVLKPQRKPANMAVRQRSVSNMKPVCVQFPHYHGRKVVVRTKGFNIKPELGKWHASKVHRRSTDGPRGITRSRTGSQSDGGAPAWFTSLCKQYGFLRKKSRPSLF